MARLFKFIFRVLLLAYIAVVLALVVPPLIGYTTATVQETTEGNQQIGTVAYAKRIPLQELNVGEKILVTGNNSVNVYTVQFVDTERAVVTVADTVNQEIPVHTYVYRMLLAVPFIGYVIIALQSMEGVIVLAMIAVLLILLCILTGIWSAKVKEKKRRKKEQEKEQAEADRLAAEQAQREAEERQNNTYDPVQNARAEAYFAARRAEQSLAAAYDDEYEEFPPKEEQNVQKAYEAEVKAPVSEPQFFDEEEDNEDADSWLHDDVDDEDLYNSLNNREATESLMATARLFAINRAAQLKEQMADPEKEADLDKTKVVSGDLAAAMGVQQRSFAEETASTGAQAVKNPVKELSVDKVINLKELKEMNADTQQIVLTINLKVISE
ncbi:MAG: hypothetical protein Q4B85_00275 [Lachnospiraceae bacterium]|nr:hypothetical protein [Lachnospiraceae bacterium]